MRPALFRLALPAAVFAALVMMGVAHGLLSGRWAPPDAPAALDHVPLTIGDWDGAAIEAADLVPNAEPGAVLLRRYVNRVSGAAVTLYMAAGRAGPIAAEHAPDSCYPGAGFAAEARIVTQSVTADDGRRSEFRSADYGKTERASPLHLRVFWAWGDGGGWQAPEDPRLLFAGRTRLYKMYIIRQLPKGGEPRDGDPSVLFLQALLPQLAKALPTTH